MTATLPPLPVPAGALFVGSGACAPLSGWSVDQVRAYGAACAAAEREQCAALLDAIAADYEKAHSFFERNAADYCAGAIRARKDTE